MLLRKPRSVGSYKSMIVVVNIYRKALMAGSLRCQIAVTKRTILNRSVYAAIATCAGEVESKSF